MASTYCNSCGNFGGHSEHCEQHPENMKKRKDAQTADFLKAFRMTELLSFPKDARDDLIKLGVSQERANDFLVALIAQKEFSIMRLLREYNEEYIPEIILLMNYYNK